MKISDKERFQQLANVFTNQYHHDEYQCFSSPGRTEIIGNHTDHNGGQVITASVELDTIAVASCNQSNVIRITSKGYPKEIVVDLSQKKEWEPKGSDSLIAGMVEGVRQQGYRISGFDACIESNVPPSAGVSSSASFEMLILCIVNTLFNEGAMSPLTCAKIGQYAENVFWKKDSGLLDQLACTLGGMVWISVGFGQYGKGTC